MPKVVAENAQGPHNTTRWCAQSPQHSTAHSSADSQTAIILQMPKVHNTQQDVVPRAHNKAQHSTSKR